MAPTCRNLGHDIWIFLLFRRLYARNECLANCIIGDVGAFCKWSKLGIVNHIDTNVG